MRMEHGLQGRIRQLQHRPGVLCINRTLIKKRLLVEFSCEHPTRYPIKRFTTCAVIYLCDKQLPQQQNSTILKDSAFCGLLSLFSYHPRLRAVCSTSRRNLAGPQALKGYTSQAGKAQPVVCTPIHVCNSVVSSCVDVVDSNIRVEALCCGALLLPIHTEEQCCPLRSAQFRDISQEFDQGSSQ